MLSAVAQKLVARYGPEMASMLMAMASTASGSIAGQTASDYAFLAILRSIGNDNPQP